MITDSSCYPTDLVDMAFIHLTDFMAAYNFGRRLKTHCGLTPYE